MSNQLPDALTQQLSQITEDSTGDGGLRWSVVSHRRSPIVYAAERDGLTYIVIGNKELYAIPTAEVTSSLTPREIRKKYVGIRSRRLRLTANQRQISRALADLVMRIEEQLNQRLSDRLAALLQGIGVPELPQTADEHVVELSGKSCLSQRTHR